MTSKILSMTSLKVLSCDLKCDLNYIIDVVKRRKFGNSSISIREVTIPSILFKDLTKKTHFFRGVALVQVQ